ncbi:hypothetical protein JCM15519_11490 [Fundidesulfovibrio butyratiphilus]
MIENRIKIYHGLAILTDLLSVCAAFLAAVDFSQAAPFITGNDGLTYLNLRFFTALAASFCLVSGFHIVFSVFYYSLRTPYASRNLVRLLPRVLALLASDCLTITCVCWALRTPLLPWQFFAVFAGGALVLTMVLRGLVQVLLKWIYAADENLINILIVGTNKRAHDFFEFIVSNRFLGYQVTGFLDDLNYCGAGDVRLLGPLSQFEKIARENVLDTVVVYLPVRSYYDKIINIIERANVQGIPVQHMYSFFDHKRLRMMPSSIGAHTGMLIQAAPSTLWVLGLKRLFDIVFSLVVLVLISPILLAAALAIKLEDGGPVFFAQQRVGYHKRPFSLIKLRTMVVDAEKRMAELETRNEMDGPVFKIKDDPRITRVGRFFRKYSIDELPQFFNVLLGHMSVVGPRPMAMRDYKGFSEDWLRRRFSVRPGITCTWQTLPNRNDVSFAQWMFMDMEYIERISFFTDMRIIVKTALVAFTGTGQ